MPFSDEQNAAPSYDRHRLIDALLFEAERLAAARPEPDAPPAPWPHHDEQLVRSLSNAASHLRTAVAVDPLLVGNVVLVFDNLWAFSETLYETARVMSLVMKLDDLPPQELAKRAAWSLRVLAKALNRDEANRLRRLLQAPPLAATDVARKLGVDLSTVTRACQNGRVPGAQKVGGKWFIPAASIAQIKPAKAKPKKSSKVRATEWECRECADVEFAVRRPDRCRKCGKPMVAATPRPRRKR